MFQGFLFIERFTKFEYHFLISVKNLRFFHSNSSFSLEKKTTLSKYFETQHFTRILPFNSLKYLDSASNYLYTGFDPTTDSLQLGNLCAINAALRSHVCDFNIIFLIGGYTALIGDPTGRDTDRPVLSNEICSTNCSRIREHLNLIVENFYTNNFINNPKKNKSKIIIENNEYWLKTLSFTDFVHNIASRYRLSELIEREHIKSRLKTGVSPTVKEFLYSMLQAYDFDYLYTKYGCAIQIGGIDQLGNVHAGIDLIKRKHGFKAFGLFTPLLTTSDGKKLGKSDVSSSKSWENGPFWISPHKISAYHLYQRILNLPDSMVKDANTFRQLTFLNEEQIQEALMDPKDFESRKPHRLLAVEIIKQTHGGIHMQQALLAARIFFNEKQMNPLHYICDVLESCEKRHLLISLYSSITPGMIHSSLPVIYYDPEDIKSIPNAIFDRLCNNENDWTVIKKSGLKINDVSLNFNEPRESELQIALAKSLPNCSLSCLKIGRRNWWFLIPQNKRLSF